MSAGVRPDSPIAAGRPLPSPAGRPCRRGSSWSSSSGPAPAPCAAAVITAGGPAQVAGPLGGRHHQRHRAVALLAAVEQPQRLHDPPGRLVLGQRDRPAVEPGVPGWSRRAGASPPPPGRSPRWSRRRRACTAGRTWPPRRRASPARTARASSSPARCEVGCPPSRASAWPNRRPERSLKRPVADDRARAAPVATAIAACATVPQAAPPPYSTREKKRQLADAQLPGHRDLRVGVLGERHQAVDVGRAPARRRPARRAPPRRRAAAPTAARVLGELRGADAGDGRAVSTRRSGDARPYRREARVTVAVTWSPRLTVPRTSTVIVAVAVEATVPVKVSLSPA